VVDLKPKDDALLASSCEESPSPLSRTLITNPLPHLLDWWVRDDAANQASIARQDQGLYMSVKST
jgi:hypothetical protein